MQGTVISFFKCP